MKVLALILSLFPVLGVTAKASSLSQPYLRLGGSEQWEYRPMVPPSNREGPPPTMDQDTSSGWRPLKTPMTGQKGAQEFWLRTVLPQAPWERAVILMVTEAKVFAVYLDGAIIYRGGTFDGYIADEVRGLSWHLISLPSGYQGKRIYLYHPGARSSSLFIGNAMLGPPEAYSKMIGDQVKIPLRENLGFTLIGVILCTLGLGAVALSLIRRQTRDLVVIFFGIYSLLYGIRLLSQTFPLWFLSGIPTVDWFFVGAFISYANPLFFTLFFIQLFGRGWGSSLYLLLGLQILFAPLAILSDLLQATPFFLGGLERVMGLVGLAVIFVNLFQPGRRACPGIWVLRFGMLVFAVFALGINSLWGPLRLAPWHQNYESYGMFVLVCSLCYISAIRFFQSEHKLAALEQEIETARHIQSSILPQGIPEVRGFDIVLRYLPMAAVAGDFYDFMVMDNRHLGVLVADVSGHGLPAALIASMVKVAYASEGTFAADPARVLTEMNKALGVNPANRFITAVCLFLDAEKRELVYSGAGHPPLLLGRKTEPKVLEFEENGLMLGPFPEATYSNLVLPLKTGDRVVLYTDGIIEAKNSQGEPFGDERFRTLIKGYQDAPAGTFADACLDRLKGWARKRARGSLDDDLTLVVVDATFA